ncbi:MAG: protein-glutamate O-methyltransferase CheR [Cellvibrionaceae bacterium]|nr:protein-glutamate O-methyltransferase CheR [Cellvibrionaceae bacterium]
MDCLVDKSTVESEQPLSLWTELLEKRTGIHTSTAQRALIQTQVSLRMRELGIDNVKTYYERLQNDISGVAEWQILVDRLVVKETTFFRHRPSLELVRQHLNKHLRKKSAQQGVNIWSIGCATGEEPYALSAIANDCFERAGLLPYFGVTAMDISLPALAIARRGLYQGRSLALLQDYEKQKYFNAKANGSYQIKDLIKKRVCFTQANILDLHTRPECDMDVIYCQNMLIYFRRWRRRKILNELVRRLKAGGILVIGLGEITDWNHPDVTRMMDKGKEVHAFVKCA